MTVFEEIKLYNRQWRDSIDTEDKRFFEKMDITLLNIQNHEKKLIDTLLFYKEKEGNSNSPAFQFYIAKTLLDMDSPIGYYTFLEKFPIPNEFWYGYVPYYLRNDTEICKWKRNLTKYILFSNYLEEKEYYKDPIGIHKPIVQYSIFFSCQERDSYIEILEKVIECTPNGNKKKNLLAILKKLKYK